MLGFPLHQRCAVSQWQVARGAQVFRQSFGRATPAALRGEVLQAPPAPKGRVRKVEHGSSIKCGLKGLRSPGSVPDCQRRRQLINGALGKLVRLEGKTRIAPLNLWLHDQHRLLSAVTAVGPVQCFARISALQIGTSIGLQNSQRAPNYALQRSWTHKLLSARTAHKLRTRQPVCAVTGRRAAAEL